MGDDNDSSRQPLKPASITQIKLFCSFGVFLLLVMTIFGSSVLSINYNRSVTVGGTAKNIPDTAEIVNRSGVGKTQQMLTTDITDNFSDKLMSPKIDKVVSKAKIIIIVAYMRTGSTLTGGIFQSFPGTFYVFEPIMMITHFFKSMESKNDEQRILKFANGTHRNVSLEDKESMIQDEIISWLNCNLASLNNHTLANPHHKDHTKIMGQFSKCIEEEAKKQKTNLNRCLNQAKALCEKAPLRIIKFIRLRMKNAPRLLLLYPNLKIIHLLRDPRGIMNSKFNIGAALEDKVKSAARKHCTTVYQDLKISKEIMFKFPGRIKIVLYEDLAERPFEVAQDLYRFSQLPFNEFVQNFITEQTHAERNSGRYSTQRKNSTVTAYKWRKQIKFTVQKIIYESCKKSNMILGYLPFSTEKALRNLTVPSRKKLNIGTELLSTM